MHLPFVSLSRFDDMLREKNTQIGYRDRRIAELEAERRMLWDKICLLGIGVPVFATTNPGRSCDPEVAQQEMAAQPVSHSSGKDEFIGHHRPSMIMRRMDRLAETRWLRKVHPAKSAEEQRDEVMNELNAAHREGTKKALPKLP